MCGICGVVGLEDKDLIKRMCKVIEHRGPDDFGIYSSKNIMLGHRRLSIIDLKTGKQPIYNENHDKVIVFNGEIYNYKEIRKILVEKGHRFSTESDTEVIIHAYEEYGRDCVNVLNGEFAFAIWDSVEKELFLARDRTGVKPLYYYFKDNIFIFSSEIKSILQYKQLKEIDKEAVHYLFNLRYIPNDKTMFKDIKKLMPGNFLVFKNRVQIKKYWAPEIRIKDKPIDFFEKELQNKFENAVKRYLIADVPVGAFLSGGLDTSSIVAFASKHIDLQTYCMGFNEPTDEFKDARIVAEKFNTDHKEIIVEFDLFKSLPKTIWAIDMPKRNMWPYFINKEASKHTKVVLGGSGGDEILGGYIYRYNFVNEILELRNRIKKSEIEQAKLDIRKQILSDDILNDYKLKDYEKIHSINDDSRLYLLNTHMNKLYSNPDFLKKIYGSSMKDMPNVQNIFKKHFNGNFIENQFLVEFIHKMPNDLLIVDDSSSMIHSLECRAPFLDKELVEFCLTIPTKYKVHDNQGKYIFRRAMKDILPKKIINKKKWGFIPNTYSWFEQDLRGLAKNILPNSEIIKKGFFQKNYVNRILEQKTNKKLGMHYNLIWNMIVFEIWNKIYIEGDVFKPRLDFL